jgi:cobalt-zinc-cadmium efflux system outer membrane protein
LRAEEVGAETASRPIRFALAPHEPIPLPPIHSESGGGALTLAEAEAMAIAWHPAMRQAEGQVRAERGGWLQVGLPNNPQIAYEGTEIGDEGRAGMQGGFVSQEFITAGKRGLNRAVASRAISAAEQRLEQTRLQILTTVRLNFYEVAASERAVVLARQLEASNSQAVKASELRLQAQEGSRASLLQSRVEYEAAAILVEQATRRREAALRRLATVLGMENGPLPTLEDRLSDPLPEFDWESARARLLSESPDLAAMQFEVERTRWAVQRAVAGRVPNVTLMSGVQKDFATNYTFANVQFGMPLQVFDRNQGNITRAGGELVSAQAALEARELALVQQLAEAMRDYQVARRTVGRYQDSILPDALQSRDLVIQAYEQGELDYLQLLQTQQTYTEKSLAYLRDLETAWKQSAMIDGLLVGPLPGSSN